MDRKRNVIALEMQKSLLVDLIKEGKVKARKDLCKYGLCSKVICKAIK